MARMWWQVLVLEAGNVAELGAPDELLAAPDGALRGMVDALGPLAAGELEAAARAAAAARLTTLRKQLPPMMDTAEPARAENADSAVVVVV
jgi:hypothetical protein